MTDGDDVGDVAPTGFRRILAIPQRLRAGLINVALRAEGSVGQHETVRTAGDIDRRQALPPKRSLDGWTGEGACPYASWEGAGL